MLIVNRVVFISPRQRLDRQVSLIFVFLLLVWEVLFAKRGVTSGSIDPARESQVFLLGEQVAVELFVVGALLKFFLVPQVHRGLRIFDSPSCSGFVSYFVSDLVVQTIHLVDCWFLSADTLLIPQPELPPHLVLLLCFWLHVQSAPPPSNV